MTTTLPPPPARPADQVRADLDHCRAAHRALQATVDRLDDEDVRRPSALPGWTVAHVVTHLARNADSHTGMAEGVLAGEARDQYPGGQAQRDGAIGAGAGRRAAELADDLRRSVGALEDAWARLGERQWAEGRARTATFAALPASALPLLRWREVEIHHADLGDPAFSWSGWSDAYLAAELPELLRLLGLRATALPADEVRRWVAVLTGRLDEPVRLPSVFG